MVRPILLVTKELIREKKSTFSIPQKKALLTNDY
jgi:hypothetical protein